MGEGPHDTSAVGALHHVEVRVADLKRATQQWQWLLTALGYHHFQRWDGGISWRRGPTYVVLEQAAYDGEHDRRRPGLSHLAFHAGLPDDIDRLWRKAPAHGWAWLYADRHPYAGGPDHYAAFLENSERFKVELVAGAGPIAGEAGAARLRASRLTRWSGAPPAQETMRW